MSPDPAPSLLPEARSLPAFDDLDAIIELFAAEELREWSSVWPVEEEVTLREAVLRAEAADPTHLIALANNMLRAQERRRGRGRPKGATMSTAKRLERWPIHRAASMLPMAEYILRSLYPERSRTEIAAVACEVVAYLCRYAVTAEQLITHRARSKKRRIQS